MRQKQRVRAQSAMEYLMTYGWAILIIAVVLGALFQLGVFSGIGTPKAQAGNCQVVKVGTGITQTISLAGECQGQEPEYVGSFNNAGNFITTFPSQLSDGSAFSLSTWIYLSSYGPSNQQTVVVGWPNTNVRLGIYTGGEIEVLVGNSVNFFIRVLGPSGEISTGKWYNIIITWKSGAGSQLYVNGAQQTISYNVGSASTTGSFTTGTVTGLMGGQLNCCGLVGYMANMQIYDTALSVPEMHALYNEGIGGAPIEPQNIVAWYPLNGNGNDYSGNENNLQIVGGVTYSSSWANGYTQP